MILSQKRGMFSAVSHPILALAVLVIAISIGLSFTQSALDFSTTGVGTLIDGDGQFVINNQTTLSQNDKIVLSSAQSFVHTINKLIDGEAIRKDLPPGYSTSEKNTHYEVTFWVELDGGEQTTVKTGKKPINEYVAFAKASDQVTNIDRVINMQVMVWNEDGSTKIAKTYPFQYRSGQDGDKRRKTIQVSTSDPFDGDDLKTWEGPNADSDVDVDGDGIFGNHEACRDSPTVLETDGLNAFYCGKGMNFVKVQIYPCDDCDETNVRRGGQNWLQKVGSALWGDASDDVANSKDVFCAEGVMYPENAPPEEQVCIQCEPEKNTCYIKGFEFPQNVVKETSFGTIAGQGDPTYLFYHQVFPIGAEEGWQLDRFSLFSMSTATAGAFGAVGAGAGVVIGKLGSVGYRAAKFTGSLPIKALVKIGRVITPSEFVAFERQLLKTREVFTRIFSKEANIVIDAAADTESLILRVVREEGLSFSEARDVVFRKAIGDGLEKSIAEIPSLSSLSASQKDTILNAYSASAEYVGREAGTLSSPARVNAFRDIIRNRIDSGDLPDMNFVELDNLVQAMSSKGVRVLGSESSAIITQYAKHSQGFRDKFIQTSDDINLEGFALKSATLNKRALTDTLTKQLDSILDNIDPADAQRLVARAIDNTPPADVNLITAAMGELTDTQSLSAIARSFDEVIADSAVKASTGRLAAFIPPARMEGLLIAHYTAAVSLSFIMLWEDSINDKYINLGTNNMVLNTPSLFPVSSVIEDDKAYSFAEAVLQHPILLDKYGRDQKKLDRFMIASPCKADLIIEKVPCNCQAKLALKPSNSDEQPVYELRQSRYNKDYWIPTKGVINNPGYDEKVYSTVSSTITSNIQTPYAYSPYGANFASVQQSTTYEFVTSTGGDDSRATIQCHDQGLFGDSLYDEEYTKNECVVVSLQKEMYDTYNDGYNYCYMRDPTSKYFAQGALLAAQIALDHAIVTGAAALALPSGGATVAVGMGGLALSGIAFHWATESIAENYKWPKGDKK